MIYCGNPVVHRIQNYAKQR